MQNMTLESFQFKNSITESNVDQKRRKKTLQKKDCKIKPSFQSEVSNMKKEMEEFSDRLDFKYSSILSLKKQRSSSALTRKLAKKSFGTILFKESMSQLESLMSKFNSKISKFHLKLRQSNNSTSLNLTQLENENYLDYSFLVLKEDK